MADGPVSTAGIPEDVLRDIRTVVVGPKEGTQEALDKAVARLRRLVETSG